MTECPDPECGYGELVAATEAVSICSTDVAYFRGHLTPEKWPFVPGHEYFGRVVEVGKGLRGVVQKENRISYRGQTGVGGLAEYRAIRPLFPGGSGKETTWSPAEDSSTPVRPPL